jgi:17beta-estradiol 17-dehydrogenase / very-long-chain 3-oxoacyl-CoA reductase
MSRFGNDDFDFALEILGLILLGFIGLKLLIRFLGLFQIIRRDLSKRYGKGSYVLITGASDGIGRQFALEFAKRGFNIILLSRTREKLEKVDQEIKKAFPQTNTLIVVSDLAKGYDPDVYNSIFDQVKHLDISILINNAGLLWHGTFLDSSVKENNDLMIVNTLPVVHLTHKILPLLIKRKDKRSAVISMSSVGSIHPLTFMSVYSATKVFVDFFSRALEKEYPKIDFLTARPGKNSYNNKYR